MQIPKLISQSDFQSLYKSLDNGRDKLIIILLYGTGCRVGELVSSRVEDVDLDDGLIHLLANRTKTKKYRSAVIPTEILPALNSWIMSLPEDCKWLFPGQKEGHLTARRVRQIVLPSSKQSGHPEGLCTRLLIPCDMLMSLYPDMSREPTRDFVKKIRTNFKEEIEVLGAIWIRKYCDFLELGASEEEALKLTNRFIEEERPESVSSS